MTLIWTVQFILFCSLFLFLAVSFTQKINLTTADLGRHIKNGEIFFEQHHPISTNFYSFTEPHYPSVNHHWLSGVFFSLIHQCFGFEGLSFFYTVLFLISFCFFFTTAMRSANFSCAFFLTVVSIPVLISRWEIRPEGFSCLFLGIYYDLLMRFREKSLRKSWLWVIPFLQIIWVNSHILFLLGLFLVAAFFLDSWCRKDRITMPIRLASSFDKLRTCPERSRTMRSLAQVGLATFLVCFINPFGWEGILTLWTMFKKYGYMLAENQSVIFMHRRFPWNPLYLHFEVIFVLGALSFIPVIMKEGSKKNILALMLFGFFSLLALKAIRSLQMFGFFFIPLMARNLGVLLENFSFQQKNFFNKFLLCVAILILGAGITLKNFYYYPNLANLPNPFGLRPGVNRSAEFFKRNHLEGPIFNNYDIGGYLIYHLFPKERVFVDNRPEAYSVSFFKEIYVPMQEDESVWREMDERYQFNVIYFFRRDMTPWAQPFLIKRIQDRGWAPVFVDDDTIILLKRNATNASLINRYELPGEIFHFEKS